MSGKQTTSQCDIESQTKGKDHQEDKEGNGENGGCGRLRTWWMFAEGEKNLTFLRISL